MNLGVLLLSFVVILITFYFLGQFYTFFNWFGIDNIEMPNNQFNRRNIKNGYFVFTIYIIISAAIAYTFIFVKKSSFEWILIILLTGFYYVIFLFLRELKKRKIDGLSQKSDLELHDEKQNANHQKTRKIINENYESVLTGYRHHQDKLIEQFNDKEVVTKKMLNQLFSENKNQIKLIETAREKILESIHEKATGLFEEIKSLKSMERSFSNSSKVKQELLIKQVGTLSDNGEKFAKEIITLLKHNEFELSYLHNQNNDLKQILDNIKLYLENENIELIENEIIRPKFKSKENAMEFIEKNKKYLQSKKEDFVEFSLLHKSSHANIKYFKRNSKNNGVDKTFFLEKILDKIFEIDFNAISLDELQSFIRSNFNCVVEEYKEVVHKNGMLKKTTEKKIEPLIISDTYLKKFIKQKGI